MRRREFITLLGGAAVGWSLAASAQRHAKIPRVGIVFSGNKYALAAFRQGLSELDYVEGHTIVLEVRSAEGRFERIPELVVELVGPNVDVLVAGQPRSTGGQECYPDHARAHHRRVRRSHRALRWRWSCGPVQCANAGRGPRAASGPDDPRNA